MEGVSVKDMWVSVKDKHACTVSAYVHRRVSRR